MKPIIPVLALALTAGAARAEDTRSLEEIRAETKLHDENTIYIAEQSQKCLDGLRSYVAAMGNSNNPVYFIAYARNYLVHLFGFGTGNKSALAANAYAIHARDCNIQFHHVEEDTFGTMPYREWVPEDTNLPPVMYTGAIDGGIEWEQAFINTAKRSLANPR